MDTWREKPVGLAAEQPVIWPRDDLLSFRKQAGAVISRPPAGFFPSQPLKKQWGALPKSAATTRSTQKRHGRLLSSFLMQKKSAEIFCGNSEKITSSSDHFVRRKKSIAKSEIQKIALKPTETSRT
jgi:hypothetical protein